MIVNKDKVDFKSLFATKHVVLFRKDWFKNIHDSINTYVLFTWLKL